ncbi:hypothetical protein [Luteococcus peritonei]|uniref:ABC-2 type transport system permease protein n=1 Tax=Luteococcus peritonei TaxID=88874 RepID=A0ABW4RR94_9ACTN
MSRALRGKAVLILGAVLAGLYLLGAFAVIAGGLFLLRGEALDLRGGLTTAGFAALTLAWPLTTLVVVGSDQTLDPGRFALYPVRARQLLPGLLVVGLVGLGGIFTCACALAYVVSWSADAGQMAAAVVGAVLGVLTCVLLARTLTSWFSSALTSRRYRDSAALVLGLLGMVFGVGAQFLGRWVQAADQVADRARAMAGALGWSPLGWAWSLPWAVGRGDWLAAGLRLALAAGLVVLLWWAWGRALDRALVSPLEARSGGGRAKEHGLADRLVPTGPVGAIAGRSLRYWRRDPRHLVQLASVALMPVLIAAPVLVNQGDSMSMGRGVLAFPVGAMIVVMGMVVAQEIGYDGSALWMEISAGVRGHEDRLGRLVACAWLLLPLVLVIDLVFLAVSGYWSEAPALVGASLGATLACAGVGSVTGALWQVPQPPPGNGGLARSSGGGVAALLMSLASMVGGLVVSAPVWLPALLQDAIGHWVGWALLPWGLAYGCLACWLGIRWGGSLLERRWPEVLREVTWTG